MQDNSDGLELCSFGTCALFGHDCACDPICSVYTSGSIWLGLEIVRRLVQITILMLF